MAASSTAATKPGNFPSCTAFIAPPAAVNTRVTLCQYFPSSPEKRLPRSIVWILSLASYATCEKGCLERWRVACFAAANYGKELKEAGIKPQRRYFHGND